MVEVTATIRNAMGIHCRPSAVIVKEARHFRGQIELIAPQGSCDPRSMMGLISLGLAEGTPIRLRLSGRGAETFAPVLAALMERHFDFPPSVDSISPLRTPAPLGSA